MPENIVSSKTVYLTGNETIIIDDSMKPKTSIPVKIANSEMPMEYAITKTSNGRYYMK